MDGSTEILSSVEVLPGYRRKTGSGQGPMCMNDGATFAIGEFG